MREQLQARGFEEHSHADAADWLVINSCSVTQEADKDCVGTIRAAFKKNPKVRIAVAGCFVQKDWQALKSMPGVRLLLGSDQKHRLGELIAQDPEESWELAPRLEKELGRVYAPLQISGFDGMVKAFVKVQDGCDRACAFCKIPRTRGRSRSRRLGQVLDEVKRLVDAGYQELTLTGVAIGLWGREFESPSNLAQLVRAVDKLPGTFRLRLSSLDPRDLDLPLIDALKDSKRFCHHLHLSLQSGSDAVLARMNRGHTAQAYEEKVKAVRKFWPDLGLTTDWIVGFPGETDQEFQESLEFCRRLEFAKVHPFSYSARQGTTAAQFKSTLPKQEVKQRLKLLRWVAEEGASAFEGRLAGTIQVVLPERAVGPPEGFQRLLEGYTGQFVRVRWLGDPERVGKLTACKIPKAPLTN